ncbi:MAG: response regulator [Akkermansiaceae bacterium]|nr:response regulator [Akkermansiaceae bacterium]MCP5545852.1 response regulator [Akkermansiaceae bacterium]
MVPGMIGEGRQIAIVDDDSSVREAVVRLLQASGFTTRAFASAEEFLGSTERSTTSVLIADIQLPGISGLELQRRLIADGRAPHTIFITGQDSQLRREDALRLGCPYFTKPFTGADLIAAVRERLEAA